MEYQVQDGNAQQADAHYGDAHNGAAGEGDAQGRVQPAHGRGGGAHVGPHRHVHTDESGAAGADGSHQVGYGRCRNRQVVVENGVVQHAQHHGNGNHKGQQRHILPAQEGPGPLADGVADGAHKVVAGFGAKHPHSGICGENQGGDPGGQGNDE